MGKVVENGVLMTNEEHQAVTDALVQFMDIVSKSIDKKLKNDKVFVCSDAFAAAMCSLGHWDWDYVAQDIKSRGMTMGPIFSKQHQKQKELTLQ